MKRVLIGSIGAVALAVLTATVLASNQETKPTPTAATERQAGPTWQYGYLHKLRDIDNYSFVTSGSKPASGKTLEELMRNYGVTPTAHPVTYASVLNALGADGWELVQVLRGAGIAEEIYYFKRPANQ